MVENVGKLNNRRPKLQSYRLPERLRSNFQLYYGFNGDEALVFVIYLVYFRQERTFLSSLTVPAS